MNRFFQIIIIALLALLSVSVSAQELDCRVNVNASQIQTSDRQKFMDMQKAINEFMNNRKWTNRKFGVEERIECSIMININKELGTDKYRANFAIQSSRPVFNTSYNTTILNMRDEGVIFEYARYEVLSFDVNSFQSNLTSVLGFYAYLIIGLDFDTFSPMGGTPFLQQAQTIVSNAQNAEDKGWTSFGGKQNRYWIIEDLLNGSLKSIREGMYIYHRQGLDVMAEEMEKGRQQVIKALEKFREARRQKSFLYILEVLMDSKADELVNIFKKAPPMSKPKAVNLLKEIDPPNIKEYDTIMEG